MNARLLRLSHHLVDTAGHRRRRRAHGKTADVGREHRPAVTCSSVDDLEEPVAARGNRARSAVRFAGVCRGGHPVVPGEFAHNPSAGRRGGVDLITTPPGMRLVRLSGVSGPAWTGSGIRNFPNVQRSPKAETRRYEQAFSSVASTSIPVLNTSLASRHSGSSRTRLGATMTTEHLAEEQGAPPPHDRVTCRFHSDRCTSASRLRFTRSRSPDTGGATRSPQ